MEAKEKKEIIYCVGIDRRIHITGQKEKTMCGLKIYRKKLLPHDRTRYFFCFDCNG